MGLNFQTATVFPGDNPTAQPPLPLEQVAPHFPQLEVVECLGRGGMGVVYKARQKSLNRLVALKLLAPERVRDAQFAERFTREAQALAALNHPNIVTIYDFGEAGGFYFLLMEFVDGLNLRQLLRARKFTPEEALAIMPGLCDALQFAHDHGIVHRDIKPENLLLDKAGRVKVADFGIAKMLRGIGENDPSSVAASSENSTLSAIGTPNYSAPEQITDPQRVDSRADIYSLGVVFYEMLTGELPGKQIEAPSRKVHIDVRLDEVVLRALETNRDLRFQQVSEIKTCVETIAEADKSYELEIEPRLKTKPAFLREVESWLVLMDAGDYALTWDTAAKVFQKAVTREEWTNRAQEVRKPLGKVLSRRLSLAHSLGSRFTLKFHTAFVGLKAAVETVVFLRENDGQWRARSYLLRPAYAEEQLRRSLGQLALFFSGLSGVLSVAAFYFLGNSQTDLVCSIPVTASVGIFLGRRARPHRFGKQGAAIAAAFFIVWLVLLVIRLYWD